MNTQSKTLPSTLFFIRRLTLYQPIQFILVAFCWILFNIWPLIPGLLAKAFFDALEGKTPAGFTLNSIIVLVVIAGFFRAGIAYIATWSAVSWHFKLWSLLRRNLFARIFEQPGAKAIPGSIGEVISTMRDDVEVMGIMADWSFDALAALIFAGGGITILLWVDARVTLLVFIPIVVIIMFSQATRARLEGVRKQSREATAQVTGSIGEIFSSVQAIQVVGAEDKVITHLRQLGDKRQQAMLRDRLSRLVFDAIFANTASLGAGLTLLVAASAMRTGEFTIGDFAIFATYLMQVAEYTGFLGYLINMYQQSGVAFKRGADLLQDAPPKSLVTYHPIYLTGTLPTQTIQEKNARSDNYNHLNTLKVTGLTYHPESRQGIENISFELKRGSFTVITGRIGSGKTTLLRALLGLLNLQAGELYWNEKKIENPANFLIPPRVAYTPQVPTLLSGTLRENILLGLPEDKETLSQAIHNAVLERDLVGFPNGLETMVGAKGVRLSGGQRQRVAAARMFVRKPQILIIDDLSSALDVETEQVLWQRLTNHDVTCLAVSHRRPVLEKADQILLLEDGYLIAQGTFKNLLQTSPEIQQLFARN